MLTLVRKPNARIALAKAGLRVELDALCRMVPEYVCAGSIDTTRSWLANQVIAHRVLGDRRASVNRLAAAVNSMRNRPECVHD